MSKIIASGLLAAGLAACAAAPAVAPGAEDLAAKWGPIIPGAHFHHVHFSVKSRTASIAFYAKHFDAIRAKFAGQEDAIWAQRSWLLFNEVVEAPLPQGGTAIGHFGWGALDAAAEFRRQKSLGAAF